jgi:IPT/TIG domain/Periplasmic copper-binding protein (NosD)/S-layer homology domain
MPKITIFLLLPALPAALFAATFTVTNADDTGAGSLRQAILDANANAGPDDIVFAIPGSGPYAITPITAFAQIADPVTIDGSTQPGYAGSPIVEIVGSGGGTCLLITGGSSTVRGLVIRGCGTGLTLAVEGDNVVEGNYIGTDLTGTLDLGNNTGIFVSSSPSNRIGGGTAAARNLISGNGTGILSSNSPDTLVQGNFIGTNAAGDTALPNTTGVSVSNSDGATIGGAAAGEGNLISGNSSDGISVSGSDDVSILGNLIGTDATGTLALGNVTGIDANSAAGFVIGAPGAGNVISGNFNGMLLNNLVTNAVLHGNFIGTDSTGTVPLGNESYAILFNTAASSDNAIGGIGPGEGNVFAYNSSFANFGAIWNVGVRNAIRGNSFYGNANLGIDNQPVGLQANDPGDGDSGGNGQQNFPLLSSVEILAGPQGSGTRIQGVLHSAPSTTYDLDFYENPGCTNFPREFLEGMTYIGSGQVTTDGSGDGVFDVTLTVAVAPDARISATATDPDGNTSEFSQRIVFSMTPSSGSSAGGTVVTLSGTDFADGATVAVGGVPATGVDVVTSMQVTATTPALLPGLANDVVVTNLDGTSGTLVGGFVSNFLDVPPSNQFYAFVVKLVSNAITAGIGGGLYGVNDPTLRQQMAVFLLRAKYGLCYTPPPCVGLFPDVPCPSLFAPWIEALSTLGITGGCGGGNYCPQNPVLRQQMAVFLLKALEGSGYVPPLCDGTFADVPCPSQFADWVEELAERAITGGCGGGNYCPGNFATRGQMATFVSKTFNLQ